MGARVIFDLARSSCEPARAAPQDEDEGAPPQGFRGQSENIPPHRISSAAQAGIQDATYASIGVGPSGAAIRRY